MNDNQEESRGDYSDGGVDEQSSEISEIDLEPNFDGVINPKKHRVTDDFVLHQLFPEPRSPFIERQLLQMLQQVLD